MSSDTPIEAEEVPGDAVKPRRSRLIGKILVDQRRLSADDVDRVRAHAEDRGMRFGDAAVALNLISPDDIDAALGQQFYFPVLSGEGRKVSDELVAAHRPASVAAESVRTLRSRLSLGWQRQTSRRVLAIVSPDKGDGRSWLAANLALAFAHVGDRTLLIDTDLRSPRQAQLFGLEGSPGLTELLTGRVQRDAIHRIHPNLRLFVLPSGELPPNPQELLARPYFDIFLNRVAESFDVIILDTPSASDCSDAQLLAARAGSSVLLSRVGHTQQSHLNEMINTFEQTGVSIVGGILNDFEDRQRAPAWRFPWRR
jgi:chain length determinant protein tyrosine kinase EpsG